MLSGLLDTLNGQIEVTGWFLLMIAVLFGAIGSAITVTHIENSDARRRAKARADRTEARRTSERIAAAFQSHGRDHLPGARPVRPVYVPAPQPTTAELATWVWDIKPPPPTRTMPATWAGPS